MNIQDGIQTLFQDLSIEEIDALSQTDDQALQFCKKPVFADSAALLTLHNLGTGESPQLQAAETPLLNLHSSTEDDHVKRLEIGSCFAMNQQIIC